MREAYLKHRQDCLVLADCFNDGAEKSLLLRLAGAFGELAATYQQASPAPAIPMRRTSRPTLHIVTG